jgi:hypothetical protein
MLMPCRLNPSVPDLNRGIIDHYNLCKEVWSCEVAVGMQKYDARSKHMRTLQPEGPMLEKNTL